MNSYRITTAFGEQSTAAEVIAGIDLTGKRAIVTGGASGIGVETVRALASANAEVTLAVRNVEAGERTAEDIVADTGNKQVLVAPLDLADPASVAAFTAAWDGPLHILVNNAGVMAAPLTRTAHGWELQFATNHLGHFALATAFHEALAAAGSARVVSVSSSAHRRSPVVFDDIHFRQRPYDPWLAYGQSKTANVLFAVEATRRWTADGIAVNALMPGGIRTGLQRYVSQDELDRMVARAGGLRRRPVEDPRAGRRHVGPSRRLAAARRDQRPVLRGLQRGRPARRRAPRSRGVRARPRCGSPLVAGLGRHPGQH